MNVRLFADADLPALTACWNRFWADAPRGFDAATGEFAARVLDAPGFADTALMVAETGGKVTGFVHHGPREGYWFDPASRPPPDPKTGMIYALCADDAGTFGELLRAAESCLRGRGAAEITLFPSWASGGIPFYNGLTPSNETSGLWIHHPLVAWASGAGYEVAGRYELGFLPRPADLPPAPDTPGAALDFSPFASPLVPGAVRLTMTIDGRDAGHVLLAPGPERHRATGIVEWAAFDVAVREEFRGKGWGKVLMRAAVRWAFEEAGADRIQLHVVSDNRAATNLYFRSLGFQRDADERYVTFAGWREQR